MNIQGMTSTIKEKAHQAWSWSDAIDHNAPPVDPATMDPTEKARHDQLNNTAKTLFLSAVVFSLIGITAGILSHGGTAAVAFLIAVASILAVIRVTKTHHREFGDGITLLTTPDTATTIRVTHSHNGTPAGQKTGNLGRTRTRLETHPETKTF